MHQPLRNISPDGVIRGRLGRKTFNNGVTLPTLKDIKQLYEHLNNGKYYP